MSFVLNWLMRFVVDNGCFVQELKNSSCLFELLFEMECYEMMAECVEIFVEGPWLV